MTILLLAGTGEGRKLAEGLAAADVPVIASLAGVTEAPKPLPVPTRVGGFGGEAAFGAYLRETAITAILDATHPFASAMSHRAAKVAAEMSLPYCQLLRPAWVPEAGEFWTCVASPTAAVTRIAAGAKVFLATGRKSLPDFMGSESMGLSHCDVTLRVVDPVAGDFPLPQGRYLVARPPFSEADEREVFERLRIDTLVVKNAGGRFGRAKLAAARALGIRVIMIDRPTQPEGLKVDTVAAALDWAIAQRSTS
ncbi:cobalt-precorrin-6A reductase [Thalassobius sp. Cn5-15]|uniref:cobalt-precorrin-6A reductase n=1 Tax=Thalassobius sp. Cn5-15 TaxID=2917763 RepID=UPI001EF1DE0D|nr:cobalt-precorrin-6A reductase [Thalassobius sp. Cn5-15]MCG7492100.1 cobalt-precorrin-6A reductase [Thalassobius sp. Cn5-15]